MNPSTSAFDHRPVLFSEVVSALAPCAGGSLADGQTAGRRDAASLFVDATYGRGGHARGLLSILGPLDRLVVLDRDPEAIDHARHWARSESRVLVLKGRFGAMAHLMQAAGLGPIDALLVDLGVSSAQLDDASRGFSFRRPGPLDMRMDNAGGETLGDWLHRADQKELSQVLVEYGELPRASARRISQALLEASITNTEELAALVRPLVARGRRSQLRRDPATPVFQALRMHINRELDELESVLEEGFALLRERGRMAVIAFHSIEDRLVKQRFRNLVSGDARLAKLPIRGDAGQAVSIVRLAKPSDEEVDANPRARSARLRVIEKRCAEMAA